MRFAGRLQVLARLLASVWLLFAAALLSASPANAQDGAPAPPEPFNVDEHGVSLTSGQVVMGAVDLSIGPGDHHGLRLGRQWVQSAWRLDNVPAMSGSTTNPVVSFQGRSVPFKTVAGAYVPVFQDGATLSNDRTVFTASDGTRIDFVSNSGIGVSGALGQMPLARGTKVAFPDGTEWTLTYETGTKTETGQYCPPIGPCQPYTYTVNLVRLSSINSSTGYQLKLTHASNNLPAGISPWLQITKVTAINNAVEYCNPAAVSCSLVNTWAEANYSNWFGPLASATGPTNLTTNYTYSSSKLTGIKPPGASSDAVTIGYNASGNVSSVAAGGGTWVYAYPSGTQTTVTDPNSNVRTINYSSSAQITSVVAGGQTTSYTYCTTTCPTGLLQQVTFPEGNYNVYTYDARGNQTSVTLHPKPSVGGTNLATSASFPSTCTNVKTCNTPTSTTDARGNVTDYTYDAGSGQVTSVKGPADASGVRPEARTAFGTVYAWTKNASGTYVQSPAVTMPISASTCRTGSAPSCVGTADEKLATLAYPTSGPSNALPSSTTVKAGDNTLLETTAITYDNYGNVVSVDGPLAGTADTSVAFYNLARQTTGAITPDPDDGNPAPNPAERITYDTAGRPYLTEQGTTTGQTSSALSSMTVTGSQVTTYDALNRPLTVASKGSDGVAYALSQTTYDTAGQVTCATTRMNPAIYGSLPSSACTLGTQSTYGPDRITHYTYDVLGRRTLVTSGYGTSDAADDQATTYSSNGQVATVKDAESNLTTYEYDGFDRLIKTRFPVGTKGSNSSSTTDYEQYGLDANGNVTSLRTRRAETLTQTYDNLDRLITKVVPERSGLSSTHTRDVYLGYDLFGDKTYARFDSASGEGISFTYDALGRQLTETQAIDGTSRTITSAYDPGNGRVSLTYPDGNYTNYYRTGAGAFYYAGLNGSSPLFYPTRNSAGQQNALYRWNSSTGTWWTGATTGYGYDPAQRISAISQDPVGTSYDSSAWWSYNPASQIVSRGNNNDAYAWTGQVNVPGRAYTSTGLNQYSAVGGTSFAYDTDGNLTSDGSNSYVYDVENRLVSATVGGATATLRYDPLGRLYEMNGSTTGITRFLYDGDDLVGEYNSSGTLLRRYVHGSGSGDDPQVWFEGSGVSDAERHYLYADERGSIVGITDSNGNLGYINSYDEYGIPADVGALTTKGRFRYTGQAWLPELGMYYYKARMYSPTLGRFMQTDPIGYGDGMNRYNYVGGDPVNGTDPTGLFCSAAAMATGYSKELAAKCSAEAALIGMNSGIGRDNSGNLMRQLSEGMLDSQIAESAMWGLESRQREMHQQQEAENANKGVVTVGDGSYGSGGGGASGDYVAPGDEVDENGVPVIVVRAMMEPNFVAMPRFQVVFGYPNSAGHATRHLIYDYGFSDEQVDSLKRKISGHVQISYNGSRQYSINYNGSTYVYGAYQVRPGLINVGKIYRK